MARPNEPDMSAKRTKKVRLGIHRTHIFSPKFIFGDPGPSSRDDTILKYFRATATFLAQKFTSIQVLKSPWALFLTKYFTKRVPEVVKIRPDDWPEKYFFWPINEEV